MVHCFFPIKEVYFTTPRWFYTLIYCHFIIWQGKFDIIESVIEPVIISEVLNAHIFVVTESLCRTLFEECFIQTIGIVADISGHISPKIEIRKIEN